MTLPIGLLERVYWLGLGGPGAAVDVPPQAFISGRPVTRRLAPALADPLLMLRPHAGPRRDLRHARELTER